MNTLGAIHVRMKNHELAGIIERRTLMCEHIECELPCATTGYEGDVDQ